MADRPPAPVAEPLRTLEALHGRVLIADDDLPNRAVLRKLLTQRGCEVLEAADGTSALQLAQQHLPDLALVDVMMPGLTGHEVLERLKQDPRTRDISVILVTARKEIEEVERGLVLGAFDYIRKPYYARELLARVRNALALKRSTDELRLWQQKMSRELEVAGSLQRKLFSTYPLFGNGYEVTMTYQPSLTIGGDVFDALPLPDGRLCVYAGDVAGHGVAPAIVSSLLKAVITEAARGFAALGPAAVCREIHSRFRYHVENPELYATLFLAILDTTRWQWICMNCGHPEPLLVRADGTDVSGRLSGGGDVPIGFSFLETPPYEAGQQTGAEAEQGSTLFLVTDGLLEARHRTSGEPCGVARLGELVRRIVGDPRTIDPAASVLAVLRQEGFELGEDDCSALAVQRIDPASVLLETSLAPELAAMADVAAQADRLLQARGWSEESAGAVQLAVMEHGTNIVTHGRPPAGAAIGFQVRLTGSVCRVLFRDQGRAWDFASQLAATRRQPEDREHGRGLGIIQSVSVHAEFYRRESENIAFFAVDRDFGRVLAERSGRP